jgi:hypothetical protein
MGHGDIIFLKEPKILKSKSPYFENKKKKQSKTQFKECNQRFSLFFKARLSSFPLQTI